MRKLIFGTDNHIFYNSEWGSMSLNIKSQLISLTGAAISEGRQSVFCAEPRQDNSPQ